MNEDRRVQRTRELLQNALLELLQTHEYDVITIGDITDRANVGRTTFYLHYESKEALYRQAHQAEVSRIAGAPLTRAEYFAGTPPDRMVAVYAYHWVTRDRLRLIYFGKDAEIIHRQLRDHSASQIADRLRSAFASDSFALPLDLIAHTLAITEIGLMMWWIEKHAAYTPEQVAADFHRMRRGILREALASGEESGS